MVPVMIAAFIIMVIADNSIISLIALNVFAAWGLYKIMSQKGY